MPEDNGAGFLPDSFSVRLDISGKGLRDVVLNFPFLFEVVEPEDIELPQGAAAPTAAKSAAISPQPPDDDAPAVCVIDSGIQEGHFLLKPAIDVAASRCFIPGSTATDVADYVAGGGHGTRVGGAVLYGEDIPTAGTPQLPFWIQNARVLDKHNRMTKELFPPEEMRAAVEQFHKGARATRIFNHSINAFGTCRLRHMSAWAAEIDALSVQYDILVVQSAGNIAPTGPHWHPGVKDHLTAGRGYPDYLCESASRVSNPGQSLQALTVGSVGYGFAAIGKWESFAPASGHPSAFTRSGPGIWDVVKPEVVEYGGDYVRSVGAPNDVRAGEQSTSPALVRSTMYPPGPASDRDATGTSFAAPKVARIAAEIQRALPEHSAILYKVLVAQSAQWPTWAEDVLSRIQVLDRLKGKGKGKIKDAVKAELKGLRERAGQIVRTLGFGIPDESRAVENTNHRTTLITDEVGQIKAGGCHVYQVPIPAVMRAQGDEFDIRIDVTLSFMAQPRRTRRYVRRYLSTWVDWKTNKLGEGLNDFAKRAMKNHAATKEDLEGSVLPWTFHQNPLWGLIRGIRRNAGTLQKDWAVVKSNTLPDHFCIAVQGHQGWNSDPDAEARYALAVSFEVVGKEIEIYDPLRVEVAELRAQIELEAEAHL